MTCAHYSGTPTGVTVAIDGGPTLDVGRCTECGTDFVTVPFVGARYDVPALVAVPPLVERTPKAPAVTPGQRDIFGAEVES